MSGQLQAPATLLPGKNPLFFKRVNGSHNQSAQFGEEKNLTAEFQNKTFHEFYTAKNIFQAIKTQRMAARECGMYGGEERCIWGFGGET